jgi:hypothetical protein
MTLADALDADVAVMAQMACSFSLQGPGLMKLATVIQNGSFPWPPCALHRAVSLSPRGRTFAHAWPTK